MLQVHGTEYAFPRHPPSSKVGTAFWAAGQCAADAGSACTKAAVLEVMDCGSSLAFVCWSHSGFSSGLQLEIERKCLSCKHFCVYMTDCKCEGALVSCSVMYHLKTEWHRLDGQRAERERCLCCGFSCGIFEFLLLEGDLLYFGKVIVARSYKAAPQQGIISSK